MKSTATGVIGLLLFALDWGGFDKWEPSLFFPKPFKDVWWHLPFWMLLGYLVVFWHLRPRNRG